MKWFKPKYTVCDRCQVHFEPNHSLYNNLCQTCRQPKLDQHIRQENVIAWASRNWERLEDQMRKEEKEQHNAYQDDIAQRMEALCKAQASPNPFGSLAQGGVLSGLGLQR